MFRITESEYRFPFITILAIEDVNNFVEIEGLLFWLRVIFVRWIRELKGNFLLCG